MKLEKTLLATWLLADQSAGTEHFAELVDKNGRILEQHGSVSTGIYAMKDLPDRNLAGCFLTERRTNEKVREAVYVQDEVVPKDENSNAEEEHLETPCPLLWYRYIITQIKLLFQPPIQTPPYISDLLRETIDRAVEREQMQNDWKEIWAKNKRHDKIQ